VPPGDTIDVWRLSLSPAVRLIPGFESFLSAEEQQRAARFRFPEHERRFRVCHAAVRRVLGHYLRQAAETIELVAGPGRKPRLAGESPLRFNLSHSGDLALLAVTTGREVGVDLEALRFDFAVESIAGYFTAPEQELVRHADTDTERARVFFRLWTRKEAVLKAAGSGLDVGLETLDVSASPPELARFPAGAQTFWKVADLDAGPDYAAALAAPPGDWRIRCFAIDDYGRRTRFSPT